ncbi:MAG: PorT family protein [Rikenellaceae bacterium]|nr:PorT family protein [Rikenellaceae bacterium]
MKKTLFVITAFLSSVVALDAQNIDLNLRFGLNTSHFYGDAANAGLRAGFNAGVLADICPAGNFFVQTGLLYSMKGAKNSESGSVSGLSFSVDDKYTLHYLDIPVQAGYRFSMPGFDILVNTGPYFAVGIGSKRKISASASYQGDTEKGSDSGSVFGKVLKRGDIGWNFEAGLKFSRIYCGLQYGAGMLSVSKGIGTVHNGNLSFNLGYYF